MTANLQYSAQITVAVRDPFDRTEISPNISPTSRNRSTFKYVHSYLMYSSSLCCSIFEAIFSLYAMLPAFVFC